jgi:hypothetical protein
MKFRNAFIALTVMALFVGLASAQIPIPVPTQLIPCTVSASSAPNLRAEGTTERPGDPVITCASTITAASGAVADRATIVFNYGVPITSRADSTKTTISGADYYASEALLMIDEPNTRLGTAPVPTFAENAPIIFCGFNTSCGAVLFITSTGYYAMQDGAGNRGANTYQCGIQTGANNGKITCFNVPIIPPGPNANRVFRLVNVRLTPGSGAITPSITVTAATGAVNGLSLTNNSATVGTPATSLTTSVTPVGGVSLCQSPQSTTLGTYNKLALLTFRETYNNAWKTQTLPLTDAAGAAENQNPTGQFVANGTYTYGSSLLSETGVYPYEGGETAVRTAGGKAIGLGDFGTRFRVVFTGLPQPTDPGTKFWISATNVADISNGQVAPANVGGQTQGAWAVMVGQSGSASNINTVERTAWGFAAPTTGASFSNPANLTSINFVQVIPNSAKSAEVVYELTNLTKNAINTLNFALYVTYTNGTAAPAVGNTATVQLGYAPFDTTTSSAAATFIPRFTAIATPAQTFFNVLPCQTSLLFPYVVGVAGYNTGLAISNTSADPYTSTTSHGTCKLDFYSSATPASYLTADVPAGTSWAALLNTTNMLSEGPSTATLTGFNGAGYMFATCNFQYAHGFAYIVKGADTSTATAMGYLAPVVADTNRGIFLFGEGLGL